MTGKEDAQKWNHIYAGGKDRTASPAQVLKDYQHLLPAAGRALDLACGLAGNAELLARLGLSTSAWDISEEAIGKVENRLASAGFQLELEVRDVVSQPPEENTFDVIVVSHFLDRACMTAIAAALRENGLLYYQTFSREKAPGVGPRNPDFTLAKNELLRLFSDMHILVYREEGLVGDTRRGFRNEAMLVAQKVRGNA